MQRKSNRNRMGILNQCRPFRNRIRHRVLVVLFFVLGSGSVAVSGERFDFKFRVKGDSETMEDVRLNLLWEPELTEFSFQASLIDQWNFDSKRSTDSDDYKRGTYVGAKLSRGDRRKGFYFDGLANAARYNGFDISGIRTGFAGDLGIKYGFLNSKGRTLGVFGRIARTENDYVPLEDVIEKNDPRDPFADPGWTRATVGGELNDGPLIISLAGVTERASRSNIDNRQRHGFDLKLVYSESGSKHIGAGNSWLPSSSYATVKYRVLNFEPRVSFSNDEYTSLNIGANWDLSPLQVNLNYEKYDYESGNLTLGGTDNRGYSVDLGAGYYGDPWSAYIYLYTSEYTERGHEFGAKETELDTSLSFFYKHQNIPELKLTFGYYEFEGSYSERSFHNTQKSISFGVDIIDFIKKSLRYDPSLFVTLKHTEEKIINGFASEARSKNDELSIAFEFIVAN